MIEIYSEEWAIKEFEITLKMLPDGVSIEKSKITKVEKERGRKMKDDQIIKEIKQAIENSGLRCVYCEYVKKGEECPSMNLDKIIANEAPMCECGLYCKIYKLTKLSKQFNQQKLDFKNAEWKSMRGF